MNPVRKNIFIIIFILFIAGLTFGGPVEAQTPEPPTAPSGLLNLRYTPPCLYQTEGGCPSPTGGIAAYVRRIYQFSVGIAGVLAVGMIVVGAIMISISGGSPDKQKEGRDYITSAIWGVVLLLGSYLILRTINPRLVALSELEPGLPELPPSAAYRLEVPQCPNLTATGCFFNEAGEACDFEDEDEVCRAVDRSTQICQDEGYFSPRRQATTTRRFPCICKECQRVPDRFVASAACRPSTLNACFLDKQVLENFLDVNRGFTRASGIDWGRGPGEWRIGEAFPPQFYHDSPGHYNGKSFDIGFNYPPGESASVPSEDTCREAVRIAQGFTQSGNFRQVLIEGPRTVCAGTISSGVIPETRGKASRYFNDAEFHLHVDGD